MACGWKDGRTAMGTPPLCFHRLVSIAHVTIGRGAVVASPSRQVLLAGYHQLFILGGCANIAFGWLICSGLPGILDGRDKEPGQVQIAELWGSCSLLVVLIFSCSLYLYA